MKTADWGLYSLWLEEDKKSDQCRTNEVTKSFIETLNENPSYQKNAKVNGKLQGLVATREKTNKCKITAIPGNKMCIGDLVNVFGETWICMGLYTDEYGMTHGEIWMCNHIFRYCNRNGVLRERYAIIDDGSYSKSGEKIINVPDTKYVCYISKENNEDFYVDKRLAISTNFDYRGEPILEVCKIAWLDNKTGNYGKGAHLLTAYLTGDLYNPETDDIDKMTCDYVEPNEETLPPSTQNNDSNYILISGKDTIRIGTSRTYKAIYSDNSEYDGFKRLTWYIETELEGVEIWEGDGECVLEIALNYDLIGSKLILICQDTEDGTWIAKKEVEVIPIG